MNYPDITIVMTIYFINEQRKEVAESTLKSWQQCLRYEGNINLHLSDDGSIFPYYPENVYQRRFPKARKMSTTYSRQERHGVGASLNAGFKEAFKISPLVLYAVDDWSLIESFDITPWAQLLLEREDVGMVRLGPPHPNLTGKIEMFTGNWQGWGMRLDRHSFAFGHRPAIYHKRMIDAYGWFQEDCSALECERLYAENFCKTQGPDIVLSLAHKWQHLDSVGLSGVEPN
jgi:hypothetical protein